MCSRRFLGILAAVLLLAPATADAFDGNRKGFLLGIDRHINDHMKVGIGYNFTDFSDDLRVLDYDRTGWFLNVVGKY